MIICKINTIFICQSFGLFVYESGFIYTEKPSWIRFYNQLVALYLDHMQGFYFSSALHLELPEGSLILNHSLGNCVKKLSSTIQDSIFLFQGQLFKMIVLRRKGFHFL